VPAKSVEGREASDEMGGLERSICVVISGSDASYKVMLPAAASYRHIRPIPVTR
jgi:hypothetical protein